MGSLVRSVRGLPDEFKSVLDSENNNDPQSAKSGFDYLEVKSDIKQNWTLGGSISNKSELFGAKFPTQLSLSVYYNNYNGLGASVGATVGIGNSPLSLGLSADSENGLGVSAKISITDEINKSTRNEHSLTLSFDGQLSVDYSLARNTLKRVENKKRDSAQKFKWHGKGAGSGISFATLPFPLLSDRR